MSSPAPALSWTVRWVETTRAPRTLVFAGAAIGWFVFYTAVGNLAGILDGFEMPDPFVLEARSLYYPLSVALSIGFGVVFPSLVLRSAWANFRRLRPVLEGTEADLHQASAELGNVARGPLRLGVALGIGSVVLADLAILDSLSTEFQRTPSLAWVAFVILQDVVLTGIVIRNFVLLTQVARKFSQIGEQRVRVDLINPGAMAPFARFGLRLALVVFVAFALGLPLSGPLERSSDRGIIAVFIVLMSIPFFMGIAALMLPVRGLRRAIGRAKLAELERVRAEISRERDGALANDGEGKTTATQRLPGLLAYEERIERVREWPFDFPARLRFGLYVLIPPMSWVAAALVERFLGLALD